MDNLALKFRKIEVDGIVNLAHDWKFETHQKGDVVNELRFDILLAQARRISDELAKMISFSS